MKSNKESELSKKKKTHVQNFINWISQQPENIVYNITNKLGEFKMKQKKQQDVTLELIYRELTGFITKQEEFNGEVREFMVKTDKRLESLESKVDAILECPTIKREIKLT